MTMDRPRRADRRTSDKKPGTDRDSKDVWRGHEPQWFKDQARHDDQRVPMANGTGEPVTSPEELTHAEGHHWQPARSGHDEAAARGYGGPPRAPAVARARRTEVLDDDGREGGEFQARDDEGDEDKRDAGEKAPKRAAPKTAARKMSKAPVRKAAPKRAAAARKAAPKRATKAAAPKRKAATKTKRAGTVKARATKARATNKKPVRRAMPAKSKSKAKARRKAPVSKRR